MASSSMYKTTGFDVQTGDMQNLFLPKGPLMWIVGNCNLILRVCPREQVGGSCGNEVVGTAPMQIPTHDDTEKQQDFKKKMYTERTQRSWTNSSRNWMEDRLKKFQNTYKSRCLAESEKCL